MANKKTTKNSKIFELLTRDNKTITKDRAGRISKAVSTSFQKKLLDAEGELQKLEDKREKLLDMSASNQTTTKNAVDDLEADGFVDEICDLDLKVTLLEQKIKVWKETKESLVG